MIVKIKKLTETTVIPSYGTENSAGIDLYSITNTNIYPNETKIIQTGIAIELPTGSCAFICSRSSLASKHGIFILNSPGIIDSDYRGEIKCILHNCSNTVFYVSLGIRIAQLLILRHEKIQWEIVDSLSTTDRGANGFGSTGL